MGSGNYTLMLRANNTPRTPGHMLEYLPEVAVSIAHRCASIEGRAMAEALERDTFGDTRDPDPAPKLSEVHALMREHILRFMDSTIDGSSIEQLWLHIDRLLRPNVHVNRP